MIRWRLPLEYPSRRARRGWRHLSCTRCGSLCRVPTDAVIMGLWVLCSCCWMEEKEYAIDNIPHPRLFGFEPDRARWTVDDIPYWTNQGRGEETKQ